jgi:hypothetical protein
VLPLLLAPPLPPISLQPVVASAAAPSATSMHKVLASRVNFICVSPLGTGLADPQAGNGIFVERETWTAREQNEIPV